MANRKYQPHIDTIAALSREEAAGCVIAVYEEWEEGGDGGHAVVSGLFWRVDDALDFYNDTVTTFIEEYHKQVWGHESEDEDEAEWDVDVHIEAMPIQGDVLDAKHVRAAIAATFSYLETYHSAKFDGPVTPDVLGKIAALAVEAMKIVEVTHG